MTFHRTHVGVLFGLVSAASILLWGPIGGFLSALLNRGQKPRLEMVHSGEKSVGARIAGGSTSGHIISGITPLSVSGMIFGAGVFATGIGTAKLLKNGGR